MDFDLNYALSALLGLLVAAAALALGMWPGAAYASLLAFPLLSISGHAVLSGWRKASGKNSKTAAYLYALAVVVCAAVFGWLLSPRGSLSAPAVMLCAALAAPAFLAALSDFQAEAPKRAKQEGQ